MGITINSRPTKDDLNRAVSRFGGNSNSLQEIDSDSMNYIYEFKKGETDCILRVSKYKELETNQVLSELDWISYLSGNGISVSDPIITNNGKKIIKKVSNGDSLLIVAFEKAKGRHIEYEEWNREFIKELGKLVGDIHKLSSKYKVDGSKKRFNWKESLYFKILTDTIPRSESGLWDRIDSLIDLLEELPIDSDVYGMVHGDINVGNFFINKGITLFDFDGCEYNWFIYDIAVAAFYTVLFLDPDQGNESDRAMVFLKDFIEGYKDKYKLDSSWYKQINLFFKLREYILFGLISSSYDLNNLPYFLEIFMDNRKIKIEKDIPYIDVDTKELLDTY